MMFRYHLYDRPPIYCILILQKQNQNLQIFDYLCVVIKNLELLVEHKYTKLPNQSL